MIILFNINNKEVLSQVDNSRKRSMFGWVKKIGC